MLITRKIDDMQLAPYYATRFYATCVYGDVKLVNVLLQWRNKLNIDGEQMNTKDSEDANDTESE
jgi:hypothetical protein